MAQRRAIAIVNPATGLKDTQAVVDRLRAVASAWEVDLDVRYTERPGHAVALAHECAGCADLLIAVGGDGTVSDVVTGAFGAATPIAIIPAGSTNMLAKDLGIPLRPRDAARVAFGDGRTVPFDIARACDTTIVHMAGAGYDAEIMSRASARWKRRLGWVAYLPPAIAALRYPRFQARIVVDGEATEWQPRVVLFAMGGSIINARLKVGVGIDRTDGLIDVCLFDPPTLLATLGCFAWIALGRPNRSRWQHQLRGRNIQLSADRPTSFEVDGDVVGVLPVTVELLDSPARIVVPLRD